MASTPVPSETIQSPEISVIRSCLSMVRLQTLKSAATFQFGQQILGSRFSFGFLTSAPVPARVDHSQRFTLSGHQ